MRVPLACRQLGGGGLPPLVILHGLFGSSRNWVTAGKLLARHFEVFALDLRGHGDSPPAPDGVYTFPALAGDVAGWLEERRLARPWVLGHSLGGKTAMRLAVDAPAAVRGLIVADIAPRAYTPHHLAAFDALRALDLTALTSRQLAEDFLLARLRDDALARFLLMNLARGEDGAFRWRLDLAGLEAAQSQLASAPLAPGEQYAGPALFLRGGQSDFVGERDQTQIAAHFPRHQLVTLEAAGHNLHADQPEAFAAAVAAFARETG